MKNEGWPNESWSGMGLVSSRPPSNIVEVEILPSIEASGRFIEVEAITWPFHMECINFVRNLFRTPIELEYERELEKELESMSLMLGERVIELGDKILFLEDNVPKSG